MQPRWYQTIYTKLQVIWNVIINKQFIFACIAQSLDGGVTCKMVIHAAVAPALAMSKDMLEGIQEKAGIQPGIDIRLKKPAKESIN